MTPTDQARELALKAAEQLADEQFFPRVYTGGACDIILRETKLAEVMEENARLQLAKAVADTLLARRDVEREILKDRSLGFASPLKGVNKNNLMMRECDTRVANDAALASYRAALSRKEVTECLT